MNLWHELTTAAARLRTRGRYTATAIGMLALAIAGNVAVFTVLSRTLIRAFPFDDSGVVMLYNTHLDASGETREFPVGSAEYVHWKGESTTLQGVEIARVFAGSISDGGESDAIKVGSVSGGIFRLFRVSPVLGSDFRPADDRPDANVTVLSDALWRRRFSGDPRVIGRVVTVDGAPRTVVGVLPASFEIPNSRADLFIPAGFSMANMPTPASRAYSAFARLKPGMTAESADADLKRVSRGLEARYPVSHKEYSAAVKPLREALYGERRPALLTLFFAVLVLHLLACVNVANLMLTRAADERGATAVRRALGARPAQIVRYRLAESLLVSALAAVVGLIAGRVAVEAILRHYADPQLLSAPAGSALMIAAFLIALTLVTALAVSLLPAWRDARVPIAALINEGSHRTSASAGQRRARELFIVVQVALAIPLLIGAVVAVKRFRDLQRIDLGFEPDRVMTAQLIMPPRYDRPARAKFAAELVRRLAQAPGVESAAMTTCTFRINGSAGTVVRSESMSDYAFVNFRRITPGFFETMSSPLVAGRPFNDSDVIGSPPVAIVSESFARQFWPGQNPLGKKLIRQSQDNASLTVVGVARDMRDAGVAEDLGPTMYTSYLQNNAVYLSIVARAEGPASSLRDTIEGVVQSIDRSLAPDDVIPFRDLIDESLGSYKLQVALLGGFAFIALVLAAVGIFAVTSYAVARRMPEVGVRMAFGAKPATIVAELVRAAGRSVAAGVVLGLVLTVAVVRALPLVSEIEVQVDPRYAAFVVAVLIGAAALASLLPALRARTARPAELLRRA